jgi:hypothetical protein
MTQIIAIEATTRRSKGKFNKKNNNESKRTYGYINNVKSISLIFLKI